MMIGAEYIRDLRLQGLKPSIIFVLDFENIDSDGERAPHLQLEKGSHAEVHIERSDNISALDFRFLTSCVVSVSTDCRDRARLLYKHIKRHRPKSITVSDSTFTHHEIVT